MNHAKLEQLAPEIIRLLENAAGWAWHSDDKDAVINLIARLHAAMSEQPEEDFRWGVSTFIDKYGNRTEIKMVPKDYADNIRTFAIAQAARANIGKINCYLAAEHGRDNGEKCRALDQAEARVKELETMLSLCSSANAHYKLLLEKAEAERDAAVKEAKRWDYYRKHHIMIQHHQFIQGHPDTPERIDAITDAAIKAEGEKK